MKSLRFWLSLLTLVFISTWSKADRFYISPVSISPNETTTLVFNFDNTNDYYGFQADITLPTGLTVVNNDKGNPTVVLSSRFGKSYQPYSSSITKNTIRVGTFSASHTPFEKGSGELFSISVNAASIFSGGTISVEGIKFIDANDKDVNFPSVSLSTSVESPETSNSLYLEGFSVPAGETKEVSILLDNQTAFTAFQTDLVLSPNLSIVDGSLQLTSRASRHTLSFKTEGKVTKVTCMSSDNYAITGRSGALLTFSVRGEAIGSGWIKLTNNIFTTPTIKEYRLADFEAEIQVTPPEVSSVSLNKQNITLQIPGEETLVATVMPELAVDKSVIWSSSDTQIASVNNNGLVKAVGLGQTKVRATSTAKPQIFAECVVNVVPTPASEIVLTPDVFTLIVGGTADIAATVLPETTTDKTITWSSDHNDIAVYENGKIKAISPGTATITATCGEATATCTVTVKGGGDITVTPGNDTPGSKDEDDGDGWIEGNDVYVHVNRTVNMKLTMPEGLTQNPTLIWKLADGGEQYVEMTPAGDTFSASFKGLEVGKTSYTISLDGKQLITGKVTVIAEITMNSLLLEPASISMARNALPQTITAKYTPQDATMAEFDWSSSNPAVATVDDKGVVTPVSQGKTVITATALDGSQLSATSNVTVTAPIDDNFEFDFDESVMGGKEGISLYIGETYTFAPKAQDGYVLPDVINWTSTVPETVSVDPNGKITALKLGQATVTASATVNGKEVSASCEVTVLPIALTSVAVSAQSSTTLRDGETVLLKATTSPSDATGPISIVWSSDDNEVATVDSSTGLVTAGAKVGKATITATANNPADKEVRGTIEINVVSTEANRVILNVYDLTMLIGQIESLTASVEPENTTDKAITWTSNNPSVAEIDPEGNLTALSVGIATITATCGEASASCTVTVKGGGDITVTPGDGTPGSKDEDDGDGWIEGNDVYVHVNRTVNMKLTMPEGLTQNPTLTWKLADGGEQFVKMTPAGDTFSAAFEGLEVGKTSYTISLDGKQLITGKVTVIAEIPMSSLELDPVTLTMAQNALPQTIKPVYTPQDASMPEFNWTSSAPTVATVDQNGKVTPVGQGQTMITATALDGSGLSATSTVTVTAPIDEDFGFDESVMGGVEGVTIYLGDSYTLVPKAHDGYQLPENIVWSSSDSQTVSVDQTGKVTGLALGSATISATATINGKEITATCTVTVIPIKVSTIELNKTTAELRATETLTLTATIEPDNATDKRLQWTTNAPSIASVSQEGVVTAHMVGEANITARALDGSNVTASCLVKVVPTIATGITIKANGSTSIKATETVQLTATVTPETTTDKTVTWKSDKPAIATVNNSGVVTGVAVGEAIITATNSAGQTADIKITVIPTLVETIELNRYTAQIKVQDGFKLTANILPLTATNKAVKWTSSAPETVSVDAEGNVLAVALGNATITCEAQDGSGVKAECQITVTTTATQSVSITAEGSTTLKATETVQLKATVLPATASDKSVRWQSANPDIATVDNTGLVTAVSIGTTQITVTNSGGQTASVTITVIATPVESIKLNKTSATLKATETLALIATVNPETATDKSLEWTSDNEAVATVNQNGVVTAIATGEAIITVKAKDGSNVTATCKVNVIATEVTSITITANGATTLKASENVQLIATILPETATNKSVRWSASAPEIANVNENGLVTAYAVGESVVTATASSGMTTEITITVIPTPVSNITLNRTTLTMRVGNENKLSATVLPETATDKTVTWASSNPEIATVDADGKVKALLEGQTSVTCTANDGSGISASCIVNVVDTDVETVTITAEGSTTLKVSETVQLTATVMPETSTDKAITWSSGNEKVAIVDADGLVTAISEGVAVITAKTSNGLSDSITITVVETQVTSITLNESTIILQANETYNLIPSIYPQTATNKEIIWSSGNVEIATVSQDGTVTAVMVGETSVTATAADGSGVTASCKVTVIPTPATSISITVHGETYLEINQTVQLTAEVLPENATDKTVVWTSSNEGVASVTETGLVTALTSGETVITATNSAGQYDRVTITVLSSEPDEPVVPEPVVTPADTPSQLLRKGDGTSHTFVAMMEKDDEVLEAQGYHYVFGYTDGSDGSVSLEDTPWRYTYTTEEIYWNDLYDFWVFSYYFDREGTLYVSSRRHLDGSVDDGFDPMDFIGSNARNGELIIGIYTIEGQYMGKDLRRLDPGIYVVKTTKSSYKVIK